MGSNEFTGSSSSHSISDGIFVGMGNPLLDISSDVPLALLEKYDLKLDSAILAEDKHKPLYNEMTEQDNVKFIAGGATLNSVRVAQWMTGVPGATGYMGCIGKDKFGETMKEQCRSDGVNAHFKEDESTPTGKCAVLINGGERSLCTDLGAANNFTDDHLETPEAVSMMEKAQFFYSAGFFLTVSPDAMVRTGKHCAENNKIYMMNISAEFLIQFFKDPMMLVMPYVDIVFGNETEALCYGKVYEYGDDIPTIALKLAGQPKHSGTRQRIVVFTQGAESTIVAMNGQVTEFPVEKLSSDLLVDTNGAGDAFVGGFISQLIQGKSIPDCVNAGHFASRVIIQQSGCTFPQECTYTGH